MSEYNDLVELNEKLRTDKESIKLYKNSRGYNWEIKILEIDIKRLVELNEKMKEEFNNED